MCEDIKQFYFKIYDSYHLDVQKYFNETSKSIVICNYLYAKSMINKKLLTNLAFDFFNINICQSINFKRLKIVFMTMEEGFEKNGMDREEIFSKAVRAGKRTYFFDVKSTKGNDYYLTITESKKRFGDDGKFFYEKHKLFLYKEDFEKFTEGLEEVVAHIKSISPPIEERSSERSTSELPKSNSEFSDVNFEDLDK